MHVQHHRLFPRRSNSTPCPVQASLGYLRWLDQNERRVEHEDAPLGLILCSAKDEEQIELLQLNQGEIRVSEYLTALPAKKLLAAKLHDAVIRVREQLARRGDGSEAE
jgi:hypothetical protein